MKKKKHNAYWACVLSLSLFSVLLSCKDGRPKASEPSPSASGSSPVTAVSNNTEPTYWNRIAPILETHCTKCHAEGGIGPMPLVSFADAKAHAGQIAYETQARHMPPWLPDTSSCSDLRHSRALAEEDIGAIDRWVKAGAPEGSKETYRAPAVKKTYAALAGEPSRVVAPAEAYAPKAGGRRDDYHCFVLDPKIDKPERVVGLRIKPGLPSLVHHVLLFEVRAGSAVDRIKEIDDREPGPGYTCFGGIGVAPTVRSGNLAKGELVDFDAQMIVGWAPGAGATDVAGAPTALPEGTAIKLAPGSKLVMQVHYSLENYAHTGANGPLLDRTRVEMWNAKESEPLKQAVWVPLLKYDFRVPANVGPDDPRSTARAEVELPLSLDVRGVAPHMHLRGKSIRVDALEGDGKGCLLDVPRWDFHHQEGYWLDKGTRVQKASVTCQWDNRASSQPVVNGKRKPTRDLRWGEGTDDEMCLAFLYATL
jgi:hypothetical protein